MGCTVEARYYVSGGHLVREVRLFEQGALALETWSREPIDANSRN